MKHRALIALVFFAYGSYAGSGSAAQATEPRVIEVLAMRYAFEPSEIDAVQGEKLRIIVRSGDGMHGFGIKKFKISKDIPRGGDPVVIEFTPNDVGRFAIACSLFCGDGHEDMKGALVVSAQGAAPPDPPVQ